jgi:hypothetical protein
LLQFSHEDGALLLSSPALIPCIQLLSSTSCNGASILPRWRSFPSLFLLFVLNFQSVLSGLYISVLFIILMYSSIKNTKPNWMELNGSHIKRKEEIWKDQSNMLICSASLHWSALPGIVDFLVFMFSIFSWSVWQIKE